IAPRHVAAERERKQRRDQRRIAVDPIGIAVTEAIEIIVGVRIEIAGRDRKGVEGGEPRRRRQRTPEQLGRLTRRHAALRQQARRATADAPAVRPIAEIFGAKQARTIAHVTNEDAVVEALDTIGPKLIAEHVAVVGQLAPVAAKVVAEGLLVTDLVEPVAALTLEILRLALFEAVAVLPLDI